MIHKIIYEEYKKLTGLRSKERRDRSALPLITYMLACISGASLLNTNHLPKMIFGLCILIIAIIFLIMMKRKIDIKMQKEIGDIEEDEHLFKQVKLFLNKKNLANKEILTSVIATHTLKNSTSKNNLHLLPFVILFIQPLWLFIINTLIESGGNGIIIAIILIIILIIALRTILVIINTIITHKREFSNLFIIILQECSTDCIYNDQLIINKSKLKRRC